MKMISPGEVQPQQPAPRPKRRNSMIIGVIVVALILILGIVHAVYFAWTQTEVVDHWEPYCTLSSATISGTETGKTQVNVTWTVTGVSRADIKWSDSPQAYAKILKNNTSMSSGFMWKTWPTGTYVTDGNTITVTLNRTAVDSGSIIKIVLVYAPAGCTFSESSVTLNYTA